MLGVTLTDPLLLVLLKPAGTAVNGEGQEPCSPVHYLNVSFQPFWTSESHIEGGDGSDVVSSVFEKLEQMDKKRKKQCLNSGEAYKDSSFSEMAVVH